MVKSKNTTLPTREDAENAVRLLLKYAGEDPTREGLVDTPSRVVRAYDEWFAGYKQDPIDILQRTFGETCGYDEIVLLRKIRFESHCEHHMVPIIGTATVGYLPGDRVVGISKLARLVDAYGKRFQIQEVMTKQIAEAIQEVLRPRGVGVIIKAKHLCISTRGAHKHTSDMVTSCMLGEFRENPRSRAEFLQLAHSE